MSLITETYLGGLDAYTPAGGLPIAGNVGLQTRVPRHFPGPAVHAEFFPAESNMRLWKPAAWGFLARVSPITPWNRARPTHTGEKSPSLVSLRGVARSSSRAPPPPADLLRRSRDGRSPPPVSLQPLHPSYQVIPLPPSPSPFISLPLLGFLLSSPLIFFL